MYLSFLTQITVEGCDGKCIAELQGKNVQVWDATGFPLYSGLIDNAPASVITALLDTGAIKAVV